MRLTNTNPHGVTLMSEDGDTIRVHPGVHNNVADKFSWNLPHRVRRIDGPARHIKSVTGKGIDPANSALAQAKRAQAAKEAAVKEAAQARESRLVTATDSKQVRVPGISA